LRLVLIVPEAGLGDAALDFGQLFIETGFLKDASADRARGRAGTRIAGSGLR